jgi:hypothetical protein
VLVEVVRSAFGMHMVGRVRVHLCEDLRRPLWQRANLLTVVALFPA